MPMSYAYGFRATVQQQGGDTSGSMELTVEVPKAGDPALLFDPLPTGKHLMVTFVTARGVSGAPYLRAPGFRAVTTSGRHIAAGTLLQRGHLSSGTLQPGELRDGLVSFSIPDEEDVTSVVWYTDEQLPTASWAG